MWDKVKTVLGVKFRTKCLCWKQVKYLINNLSFYSKKLKREEQSRPKVSRRKETIKEHKSMK